MQDAISDELFMQTSDGVDLCYQTFGPPDGEPLLLIMGLGGPMTWWPVELCELLATRGFLVIRYDNRDTGRSTKVGGRVTRGDLMKAFLGRPVTAPYGLDRMAQDVVELLDHLGFEQAHLCGVSMGGMIAQTVATTHPGRVRSLTSVMSTTGNRFVGFQNPRLVPNLLARRKPGREAYVEGSVGVWRRIGSPGYPVDADMSRLKAGETWDRGFSAGGVLRHMLAVLTQHDRTKELARLTMPAAVIHGLADPLVHVSGGRATARAIRGAELVLVPGMGHDLPPALFRLFVDTIRRTADRAGVQTG